MKRVLIVFATTDGHTGKIAGVLSERNTLPKNAQAISAAWAQGAADRLAIDRLVEKLSRAVGGGGTGD